MNPLKALILSLIISVFAVQTAAAQTVAIIDTGVSANPNISGYVFKGGDNAYDGHGTMMARTVHQYAPKASIHAYSCDLAHNVELICAAGAVKEATDAGADIINLSFTLDAEPVQVVKDTWQEAIAYARARGVVIYASAGNSGSVGFPANQEGIISVSSKVGQGGIITGPNAVDVAEYIGVGPSYTTALASSLSANNLLAGKPAIVSGAITVPETEDDDPPTITRPVDPVFSADATYLRAQKRLHITWTGREGAYKIKIGKKIYTSRGRQVRVRVRTKFVPRVVRVKAPGKAWKTVRVYRA